MKQSYLLAIILCSLILCNEVACEDGNARERARKVAEAPDIQSSVQDTNPMSREPSKNEQNPGALTCRTIALSREEIAIVSYIDELLSGVDWVSFTRDRGGDTFSCSVGPTFFQLSRKSTSIIISDGFDNLIGTRPIMPLFDGVVDFDPASFPLKSTHSGKCTASVCVRLALVRGFFAKIEDVPDNLAGVDILSVWGVGGGGGAASKSVTRGTGVVPTIPVIPNQPTQPDQP